MVKPGAVTLRFSANFEDRFGRSSFHASSDCLRIVMDVVERNSDK